MTIFNGNKLAKTREDKLKQLVSTNFTNNKLTIAAILFKEDAGSRLYTKLKSEAASRVGIEYHSHEFSLSDLIKTIQTRIDELNSNPNVTGIIIQKPWRKTWLQAQSKEIKESFNKAENPKKAERIEFSLWWSALTNTISEKKDVDGLHPNTIAQIKEGTWKENGKVLPATCQAVLTILEEAEKLNSSNFKEDQLSEINLDRVDSKINLNLISDIKIDSFNKEKYIVLGKSDLLGIPLFYELKRQNKNVEIIASKELNERMKSGQKLLDASVVVSATGRKGLITGDMVKDNVIIVDVGEPKPDVDFESVSKKAAFITPVPGGVGPMTVAMLLKNTVTAASLSKGFVK